MLMSVFVQNIVDMIVDYALWVSRSEEGVFEDHRGQIVARSQMNKDGNSDK